MCARQKNPQVGEIKAASFTKARGKRVATVVLLKIKASFPQELVDPGRFELHKNCYPLMRLEMSANKQLAEPKISGKKTDYSDLLSALAHYVGITAHHMH